MRMVDPKEKLLGNRIKNIATAIAIMKRNSDVLALIAILVTITTIISSIGVSDLHSVILIGDGVDLMDTHIILTVITIHTTDIVHIVTTDGIILTHPIMVGLSHITNTITMDIMMATMVMDIILPIGTRTMDIVVQDIPIHIMLMVYQAITRQPDQIMSRTPEVATILIHVVHQI
jgi:hypothetical protein